MTYQWCSQYCSTYFDLEIIVFIEIMKLCWGHIWRTSCISIRNVFSLSCCYSDVGLLLHLHSQDDSTVLYTDATDAAFCARVLLKANCTGTHTFILAIAGSPRNKFFIIFGRHALQEICNLGQRFIRSVSYQPFRRRWHSLLNDTSYSKSVWRSEQEVPC